MGSIPALLLAFFLSAGPPGPARQGTRPPVDFAPAPADSALARARAELAITEFQIEWQRTWKISERTRQRSSGPSHVRLRRPYFHCHNDMVANQIAVAKHPNPGNLIKVGPPAKGEYLIRPDTTFSLLMGSESAFGLCPTWLLAPLRLASDESHWRDGAILPTLREHVKEMRGRLLLLLDTAALRYPADQFVNSQRVRFHVDQQDWRSALNAARACRSPEWWCSALEGFALTRAGATRDADSVFDRMRRQMSDAERCRWIDASDLLPKEQQGEYRRFDCATREEMTQRLWWMADPLYRDAGNERLVEQESRRVEILLRQGGAHDERYAWYADRGGDAFPQLMARYGWPSYTGWAGQREDNSHTGWLRYHRSPAAEPYTTFEYTLGRARTLPQWDAVAAPFESVAGDWMLSAETAEGEPAPTWWPVEHFKPRRRLVPLGEGQTAFFRRQSFVTVATALRVIHPVISTEQTLDVLMLGTTGPGRVDSLAHAIARGGSRVVLQGNIDTLPALLAVEAAGRDVDARLRFGVVPPRPLSSLRPREIALSEPVLLEPGMVTAATLDRDDLLNAMLPSADIGMDERNLHLFWESYGVGQGDTVTVSVRVTRDVSVGRLRRIGITLNIATDPTQSVEVRWTEPDPNRIGRTLAGPVPVQLRLMALNLSNLPAGTYLLEVGMQRPGAAVVRSQRRFSIVP